MRTDANVHEEQLTDGLGSYLDKTAAELKAVESLTVEYTAGAETTLSVVGRDRRNVTVDDVLHEVLLLSTQHPRFVGILVTREQGAAAETQLVVAGSQDEAVANDLMYSESVDHLFNETGASGRRRLGWGKKWTKKVKRAWAHRGEVC